jgi:hypothetical protein
MAKIKKKSVKKSKAKPKRAVAKKASSAKPAAGPDLRRELAEALERQAATGDILRMIARSSGELQSVMDAIAEKAARLCDADDALVRRLEGDCYYAVAHFGSIPTVSAIGANTPLDRGTPAGRAVIDRETVHVNDLVAAASDYPGARTRGLAVGVRTALATPLLRCFSTCAALRRSLNRPSLKKSWGSCGNITPPWGNSSWRMRERSNALSATA